MQWGSALENLGENRPWTEVQHFYDKLKANNEYDKYFESAKKFVDTNSVIFTGYLTHKVFILSRMMTEIFFRELCCLFPCCDVAIFPSVVAEAGPLVFLEALASGEFF